jgi:hypothetical protein
MQFLLAIGMWFGGCLMLLGLLSACSIVGLGLGAQLIWVGLLLIVCFYIARQLFKESA